MWTDDEIDELMEAVGYAGYLGYQYEAYQKAVEIGRQMRDEANERIEALMRRVAELEAAAHDTQPATGITAQEALDALTQASRALQDKLPAAKNLLAQVETK